MLSFNTIFLNNHCFCELSSHLPFSDFVSLPLVSAPLNALAALGWRVQAQNRGLDESSIKAFGAKKAIQLDLREERAAISNFYAHVNSSHGMIRLIRSPPSQEKDFVKQLKEMALSDVSVKDVRLAEKALVNYFLEICQGNTHLNFCQGSPTRFPRVNLPLAIVEEATLENFPINSEVASRHPLPQWIFQLPKLKALTLKNLGLRTIPDAIGFCAKLEELHIQNVYKEYPNQITELPKVLGTLTLRTLSLKGVDLPFLPDVVCELSTLKDLRLKDNPRLETLPLKIAQLQQLENLQLDNTGLKIWPKGLFELNKIQVFYISQNHLWDIEDEAEAWLNRIRPRLTLLDASDQSVPWSSKAKLIFQSLDRDKRTIRF